MSSCLPLIFMALTSFLVFPRTSLQTPQQDSVADLLLADEIEKAEALLAGQPHDSRSLAFEGQIAFRRGNFERAEALYRQALQMDERTGWAHLGLGKLDLA